MAKGTDRQTAQDRTLNMFRQMKIGYHLEDQTTLNRHIHMVKHKFLSNKFFTIGHLIYRAWNGEDFNINYPILMHHANWVEGIENKIKILDIVRKKIENR